MTEAAKASHFMLRDGADVLDAPWAGALVALGARLARRQHSECRQLLVVVTVPTRDFAACLVAAGWVLAQRPPHASEVKSVLPLLVAHEPVRVVARSQLVGDMFYGVAVHGQQTRLHIGGSWWDADYLDAIAAAPELDSGSFGKLHLPATGSLIQRAHPNGTWHEVLVGGAPTVRIIGTLTRLKNDLDIELCVGSGDSTADAMRDVLWPLGDRPVGALSSFVTASTDELPDSELPVKLTILDGVSALDLLSEVTAASHVVVVLDRGAAENEAASQLVELRARSEAASLEDLGWRPPPGIEGLAFEVQK